MEADAKAKVAKLKEMEADHNYSQRGRKALLVASLFLNLTFIVTIYAILLNQYRLALALQLRYNRRSNLVLHWRNYGKDCYIKRSR